MSADNDIINNKCVSCGALNITIGATPLCTDCREYYIKYPIPKKIKIGIIIVIAVFLFSLISFPKQLNNILLLQKAKKSIAQQEYLTAEKNLDNFLSKNPTHLEANSLLLIASYYNSNMLKMGAVFNKLKNEKFEDLELLGKMENVIQNSSLNFESDTLISYMESADTSIPQINHLIKYHDKHPDDYSATYFLANLYVQEGKYEIAETLFDSIYKKNTTAIEVIDRMVCIKRLRHKYQDALGYCEEALHLNKQYISVLAQKARIWLVLNKKKEALKLAEETVKLQPKDSYALATLAIAYHYNNMYKDRDKIMSSMSLLTNEEAVYYTSVANDIISGKEKLE